MRNCLTVVVSEDGMIPPGARHREFANHIRSRSNFAQFELLFGLNQKLPEFWTSVVQTSLTDDPSVEQS
jgi:hypothetical protein